MIFTPNKDSTAEGQEDESYDDSSYVSFTPRKRNKNHIRHEWRRSLTGANDSDLKKFASEYSWLYSENSNKAYVKTTVKR